MANAAAVALGEARRRAPLATWGLAGIRVGAAAVALAASSTDAASLLLIRPALDPAAYFSARERASRRASLGRNDEDAWAFGHPLPRRRSDVDVAGALTTFRGPVVCLAYESDPVDPPADGLDAIRVGGSWDRTEGSPNAKLVDAALDWAMALMEPARG
jgi:hypothetical protein